MHESFEAIFRSWNFLDYNFDVRLRGSALQAVRQRANTATWEPKNIVVELLASWIKCYQSLLYVLLFTSRTVIVRKLAEIRTLSWPRTMEICFDFGTSPIQYCLRASFRSNQLRCCFNTIYNEHPVASWVQSCLRINVIRSSIAKLFSIGTDLPLVTWMLAYMDEAEKLVWGCQRIVFVVIVVNMSWQSESASKLFIVRIWKCPINNKRL